LQNISLVLDGCFDGSGHFVYAPIKNTKKMTEYFRRVVIKHFVENGYITKEQALNLISWKNSGFSIDNSV
jgi:membrane carboxypeptidase/penicillin-binding protein